MSEKKRDSFLDCLRIFATCAVVMLHTISGVMDNTDMNLYPAQRRIFLAIFDMVRWCVPVFLMISGYLFLNPRRELKAADIVGKYCKRIAMALFLFGVPYACIEQIAVKGMFTKDMIGESFLMVLRGDSWSHMWYLYLIFFLYLITPCLRWILFRVPVWFVWAVNAGMLLLCSLFRFAGMMLGMKGLPTLPEDGIYLFYYLTGYLFAVAGIRDKKSAEGAARKTTMENAAEIGASKKKGAGMLSAGNYGFAVACGLTILVILVTRLRGFIFNQMAYAYPIAVILALLLFCWGYRLQVQGFFARRNTAGLEKIGGLCFTVYLVHPIFLNLYYKYFEVTPLDYSLGISIPLFFLGTLLPSFVVAWILCKIKPLKKWVL